MKGLFHYNSTYIYFNNYLQTSVQLSYRPLIQRRSSCAKGSSGHRAYFDSRYAKVESRTCSRIGLIPKLLIYSSQKSSSYGLELFCEL